MQSTVNSGHYFFIMRIVLMFLRKKGAGFYVYPAPICLILLLINVIMLLVPVL